MLEIVKGLPHAHVYDVCERFSLRQAPHLVYYLTGCQVGLKPLASGHAKAASHTAPHLRGNTQGGPFPVGDVGSLDEPSVLHRVQVLFCAI